MAIDGDKIGGRWIDGDREKPVYPAPRGIVSRCIVLYIHRIVLYRTALYRIVLYCIALYCIVPYRFVLYRIVTIVLYWIASYCIELHRIVSHYILLHRDISHSIALYRIVCPCAKKKVCPYGHSLLCTPLRAMSTTIGKWSDNGVNTA